MLGITGTNGKTTTAFLVEAALRAAGRRVGTIGTIGFRVDGTTLPGTRTTVTTPESPDLMALLAVFAERGADSVVMEVSSHALALHRVDGVRFAVGAFVNLGRDHLDFHHTMEEYFEAKARLFEPGRCEVAVINVDDPYGRRLAERITASGAARLVTTGTGDVADYRIVDWRPTATGSIADIATPTGAHRIELALPGDYNVRNAVTALAMLDAVGVGPDAAAPGLVAAQVPGRMQVVDLGRGAPRAVVDFAHTPQAIASALSALPPGAPVVVVAGGRRRPRHGQASADGRGGGRGGRCGRGHRRQPRTEDPARDPRRGARRCPHARAGRGRCWRWATGGRRSSRDCAGPVPAASWPCSARGTSTGRTSDGRMLPFDDVAVLRECWARLSREER